MNWEPFRADHSIVRATAYFSFPEPLNQDALDNLIIAARKSALSVGLNDRAESLEPIQLQVPSGKNVVFQLGSSGINVVQARQVMFRQLDQEEKVINEFTVNSRTVLFSTFQYQRWQNFFPVIETILHAICGTLSSQQDVEFNKFREVRLEYIDKFTALIPDADHYEIIARPSPYLAPELLNRNHALHCHLGWFEFDAAQNRSLVNVNIDVGETQNLAKQEAVREISILTMKRIERIDGGALESPLDRLSALHDDLKLMFRQIITDKAAHRISLAAE